MMSSTPLIALSPTPEVMASTEEINAVGGSDHSVLA